MNGDGRSGPAGTSTQRAPSARRRSSTRSLLSALLLVALLAVPGVSHAAVSVSRAELSGDRLRIEGTATPSRTITVDGVAMATSDGGGQFRVERSGFTAPADCTVDVDDGSGTPRTAQLSGCTVSSPPPPPPPPPPPAEVTLSTLTLSQTTVVGGSSVTGTVTLTGAAPSGGFAVSLASSDPGLAAVPSNVSVAADATSAGFPVTTTAVNNTSTATITATGGGVSRSVTLTVVPQSPEQRGSISLARGCVGPCGGGTVTSVPAGVSCTFTPTTTSGACSNVFFPIGTQVRLEARADASSKFAGWEFEVSCREAPKVTIQAGVAHICRPVFNRR